MEYKPREDRPTNKDEHVAILAAWPYANGPRHLGHGAALIPGDILARYHRSAGANVLMVSGTDEHGTPNLIAAEQAGVDPNEYVTETNQIIRDDFTSLGMSFDWFTRTSTPEHQQVTHEIFSQLVDDGYIEKGTMLGTFDSVTGQSLPDRYVEGRCPNCGSSSRGDQCENCNALLDPQELVEPLSKITGNPVDFKDTEHYFLMLDKLAPMVREWMENNELMRPNAKSMSLAMLDELRPRAITRDMAWGVPLPEGYELEGENSKVLYVWFEAVIGYLSASIEWSQKAGGDHTWEEWWQNDDAKHYYVMGKDNVPFHTIIWPAIISGARESSYPNMHYPDTVASTEYLTFKDGKFSSSRGNVLYIRDLTELVGPDALRYYLISSGPESSDVSFSVDELTRRTNDELVAKWGNLVSRTLSLLNKNYDGVIPTVDPSEFTETDIELFKGVDEAYEKVGAHIGKAKFAAALKEVMNTAALVNKYLYDEEPWKTVKTSPEEAAKALYVATTSIQNIATLMAPFLPHSSQRVNELLGNSGNLAAMPESIQTDPETGSYALSGDYEDNKDRWHFTFAEAGQKVSGDKAHLFAKQDAEKLEQDIAAIIQRRQLGKSAIQAQ